MKVDEILAALMYDKMGQTSDNLMPLLKAAFELGQRTPINTPEIELYTTDQQRVVDFLVERSQGAVGGGMDPIGFLIASYAYMADQLKESQSSNTDKLHAYCLQFIRDQRIDCAETVYQSDRVIAHAYEFIHGICDIVGYHSLEHGQD